MSRQIGKDEGAQKLPEKRWRGRSAGKGPALKKKLTKP